MQSPHWRTGPTLVPSFEHQQTCTQSVIEGEQAGLGSYEGGEEYSPVFSSEAWCSETDFRWAEWHVEDKNISQEKEIPVILWISHFIISKTNFHLLFTIVWQISQSVCLISHLQLRLLYKFSYFGCFFNLYAAQVQK